MKISPTNWAVTQTENLYKNINQKLAVKPEVENQSIDQEISGTKKIESKQIASESILSEKERTTLRMLFGESKENKEILFYGRNKLKNVQSGFFLDLKG